MLSVVTWLWGNVFGPQYCNRLRSMLGRHLHLHHELVVVTNNAVGLDREIRVVAPPAPLRGDIRCRRRMWQYAAERRHDLGARILAIDLDVVVVRDLTPIVDRPEPICCWKVGHAGVFSGSFQLFDAGALHEAYAAYVADPLGFPAKTGEKAASDQAMLNFHLRGKRIAQWSEADGFVTWYGNGYESKQHWGMSATRPELPPGARIVVLGSSDKRVLDEGRYPFVVDHWR